MIPSMVMYIDHKLRISLAELPADIGDLIEEALTIPNVEREKAMKQGIYGWQAMADSIPLWRHDRGFLEMPRGFLPNLIRGLEVFGIEYAIEDKRSYPRIPEIGTPILMRPWQEPAVRAILEATQGIYKAPAGSGKTVAVLEAVRRLRTRSIVLVNTKDILQQWVKRVEQHLGPDFPVGTIGDGVFDPSTHITIATVQTLHRRFGALQESGFFDEFGFLCLDECHHATAHTYNRLVDRFSCRYRIGVSATPDKTGDFALATNMLGPVFHETKKKDVDMLIDPVVYKIPTSFSFKYRGAQGHRPSNYSELLKRITTDDDRNRLIVKTIMLNEEGHSLIVSKRLEHLDTLRHMLMQEGYSNPIRMLTGPKTNDERRIAIKIANEHPCAIFSTLADEALDIPRLDQLFLVFPQRNPGLIQQQVGRIARTHPEKTFAKVFDFCDPKVGPLDAQWRVRRLQVYQPHKLKIVTVNPSEIMVFGVAV